MAYLRRWRQNRAAAYALAEHSSDDSNSYDVSSVLPTVGINDVTVETESHSSDSEVLYPEYPLSSDESDFTDSCDDDIDDTSFCAGSVDSSKFDKLASWLAKSHISHSLAGETSGSSSRQGSDRR
jgi:hypothetical protein